MGIATKISWTDSTFNPFIGCTKVGPGCDLCYAEAQDHRWGGDHWGPRKPRRRTSENNWAQLRKWNARAAGFLAEHGHLQRVFIASMADVLDPEVPTEWRTDLWREVDQCRDLEIQIVTKRIGNAVKMIPGNMKHVGVIATVVTQEEVDRDVPKLIAAKAALDFAWCGLSIEPQLEDIDLTRFLYGSSRVDWVISGGESGPVRDVRPYDIQWGRNLMLQCRTAGVAFFQKQLGSRPLYQGDPWVIQPKGKYDDLAVWPEDIRVQQFPTESPFARNEIANLEKNIGKD